MIISVSGKINSGKDTVGEIVQIISASPHFTDEAIVRFLGRPQLHPLWENKKFADKLKDMACMLLGCTREQLEDREFKEKELGPEWDFYQPEKFGVKGFVLDANVSYGEKLYRGLVKQKMTPRLLMQLIGTECGRQIIHPNIWVNALMSEYKRPSHWENRYYDEVNKKGLAGREEVWGDLPNWIITDMRFPNEMEAVKDRGGISIRVDRFTSIKNDLVYFKNDASDSPINGIYRVLEVKKDNCTLIDDKTGYSFGAWFEEISKIKEHESETALDNSEFDYTIENNSSIEDLIHIVSLILKKEKII